MKNIFSTFFMFCFLISSTSAQDHDNIAFFGIHSNSVSTEKAKKLGFENPNGIYITNVISNTSAERAGFQPFDYIYQIDDKEFKSHQSMTNMMRNYKPTDQAMIYFIRGEEQLSKKVVFGKASDLTNQKRNKSEDPFLGIEQNHSHVPSNIVGISVDVLKNSTAEAMGMEDDDIITKINGFPIVDWHDAGAAIDALEVGDPIKVTYVRNNTTTTVVNPVRSLAATKNQQNHGSYNYSYSYSYSHGSDKTQDEKKSQQTEQENQATDENIELEIAKLEIEMQDMPEEDAAQMKKELGIEMPLVQNLQIERLNIFPNPSQGLFNVTFDLPNTGITLIRIFNSSGKLVYSNDLQNFSGVFNEQIDLTENPAGTYYLMVQQGDLSISKKITIIRA